MLPSLFTPPCRITYPPFKHGLYLEEYFLQRVSQLPPTKRLYIPALWTNFQIEPSFRENQSRYQQLLDQWVAEHPSPHGYYTVIQHDDASYLRLPSNTIVYGACSGTIPIPLIYEDTRNTLRQVPQLSFSEKPIVCSFVGTMTHGVRNAMVRVLSRIPGFQFYTKQSWVDNVPVDQQRQFIETTRQSKFALAPRGYGRSSFRFFEILQLGCIPIYVWDDIEWLPYKEEIDYHTFCISIHVSQLATLPARLHRITEQDYSKMLKAYASVQHLFTLEGLAEYVIRHNHANP